MLRNAERQRLSELSVEETKLVCGGAGDAVPGRWVTDMAGKKHCYDKDWVEVQCPAE